MLHLRMEPDTYSQELVEHLTEYATRLGADYAAFLFQEEDSGSMVIENGELKAFEEGKSSGLGIRVLVDESLGIASSTKFSLQVLKESVKYALRMAKASKKGIEKTCLSGTKPLKATVESAWKKNPDDFSDEEKLKLLLEINKAAQLEGIVSSNTRMGWLTERRLLQSSEGALVETTVHMSGLAHSAIALAGDRMESMFDSKSRCAGFEFISDVDWQEFSSSISNTALKAVQAPTPGSGNYKVVADPALVGLIFHEALGHASEGDLVTSGESVLEGCLGKKVASPLVTIVDQGILENGYYVPFDDEGVEKKRQVVVEEGYLRGFLHSRSSAMRSGCLSTGNARCQSFGDKPLVRQTNYFIEGGDRSLEELLEGIDYGIYLCGRGARGGEVDVGRGAFTFNSGPSFLIRKGELAEMIRGVSVGGMVLDTLNHVTSVGKDVSIQTSIFGGCGKDGQRARVGHGGPHILIDEMAIGGKS